MVGWHHRLNGHEFEKTSGDSEGQGNLACYSPWNRKEMDILSMSCLNNNTAPPSRQKLSFLLSPGFPH